jgi:hypothetical protein
MKAVSSSETSVSVANQHRGLLHETLNFIRKRLPKSCNGRRCMELIQDRVLYRAVVLLMVLNPKVCCQSVSKWTITGPNPCTEATHNYHYKCCGVSNYAVDYTVSTSKAALTHHRLYWGAAIQHASYRTGIMRLTNTRAPAVPTARARLLSCWGDDCNPLPYGQNCKGIFTCLPLLGKERIRNSLLKSTRRNFLQQVYQYGTSHTSALQCSKPVCLEQARNMWFCL